MSLDLDERKLFDEDFEVRKFVGMMATLEVRGQKLYTVLAGRQTDPKVKNLFENLALEEKQHVKDFLHLAKVLEQELSPGENCTLEDREYLQGVIASHLLFQEWSEGETVVGPSFLSIDPSAPLSAREALELALRFERDSIMIFQELSDYVCDSGQTILKGLIKQERVHITKLIHLFKEV